MRLYLPEEEDSDGLAERWSDVITTARRRRNDKLAATRPSAVRKQPPWSGRRFGAPIVGVAIALWLTAGVWGARPPGGDATLGHLILAEFSIDHILGEWQLDGWSPRFNLGYETFLILGPGFFWAVGLVKLLSLGLLSTAGAFKVVVVTSFLFLPLVVAFLARSFGLDRREAGIAAILALAVNSPFGGMGLHGLFGKGLVIQQFAAVFFFLALGSILRLVADPTPRWTILTAATLTALLITHTRSVIVLGAMLLILFVAVLLERVVPALVIIRPGPWWTERGLFTSRSHERGPQDDVPLLSGRVLGFLLAATALASALASFHLLPLLPHRDLQGPVIEFATPPLAERLGTIMRGEVLFHPFIAFAVLVGWGFAFTGMRKYRPHMRALAATPVVYLVVTHWAVRQWPGSVLAHLPEGGLGYAGGLAILPLAVLFAHLSYRGWGWRGDAGTLALAAALVVISQLSARDVARQMPDPIPQMHEAARQLRQLVPDQARFATARNTGESNRTGIPNPDLWLAWASGRNTLNNFGPELPGPAERPLEAERFVDKPPDSAAETLSRLGVTHVVALSDESAERLGRSRLLTEVWRSSPLAILAVSPRSGQPPPAALVTFDAPGRARLVGSEPNLIAIQTEPSHPTRATATIAVSWSPKWQGLLDGQPVNLRRSSNGLIELDVPAGSARLMLKFGPDSWDRLGWAATLATLVLAHRRRARRRASLSPGPGVAGAPREVEALREVSEVAAAPVTSSRAERVAQALLEAVDVSSGQEPSDYREDDAPSRAERVAQALLAAGDPCQGNEPVRPSEQDIGAK
ncbi:MAG: hypothetical protein M3198_07910 [Actinomycetota bacterium]|nr:hypothetical protein [Actinomycetota bacterium]